MLPFKIPIIAIALMMSATHCMADTPSSSIAGDNSLSQNISFDSDKKIRNTNIALTGGIVLYGFMIWDWDAPDREFNFKSEGWFGRDTKHGGADKLGHVYTGYLSSRMLASLYRSWGVKHDEALRQAILSSILLTTVLEVGDGFSNFGFSHEDVISNSIGQLAAYYLETYPQLDEKLDLRLEYDPFSKDAELDPTDDYDAMKYLLALKMSGFNSFDHGMLRYLEFHLGYYTRGFEDNEAFHGPERNLYAGVGINLSQLFSQASYKKTAKVFNYFQMPNTYLEHTYRLDN